MVCINHEERESAAQCVDCGVCLCAECAGEFKPVLCHGCAAERRKGIIKEIVKDGIKSLVYGLIGLCACGAFLPQATWLVFLLFVGMPWGYAVLDRIFPYTAGGNIVFMLVVFIVKAIVATAIGFVVLPFKLVSSILTIVRLPKI